uniref:Putative secreted protein n=1 Tax=Panstrongylus lignarius TaxID=156445 RepID=A0A224Y292_9HEMI
MLCIRASPWLVAVAWPRQVLPLDPDPLPLEKSQGTITPVSGGGSCRRLSCPGVKATNLSSNNGCGGGACITCSGGGGTFALPGQTTARCTLSPMPVEGNNTNWPDTGSLPS